MNFQSPQQKAAFRATLREFAQSFGLLALVVGLLYLWLGLDRPGSWRVNCDAEQIAMHDGRLAFVAGGYYFGGADHLVDTVSHSGKQSMALDRENAFGFHHRLPDLLGNEEVTVSVWRKAAEGDASAGLAVLSVPGQLWRAADQVVEQGAAGWERISVTVEPQPKLKSKDLRIYCWNPGRQTIFFDDLEIRVERKEKL